MGATPILRDIDLTIRPGETLGLFGANGAGKTTLLRLLATLTRPASGTATVLGADLDAADRFDVRSRIGYVGHSPGLYPELTLGENLRFVADAMGIDPGRIAPSLEHVGLGAVIDRRADRCSHGMKRRAEFARIHMVEPDFLLLDEPHSALDADAVALVDDLVRRTTDKGGGAVLVSHERERVNRVATRTCELSGGTIT